MSFRYCSFAYSNLACLRMGMSVSASFRSEHGLFTLAEDTGPRIVSLSLYRGSSLTAFEVTEIELLRLLLPHLQHALLVIQRR
jgi:hypothetical protein